MPHIYKTPNCEKGELVYEKKKCKCKIKTKKLKKKTSTKKCTTQKKKECAKKNKICNTKTNRCKILPKKTAKKTVKNENYRVDQAKKMLDSNLITQQEFDEIKHKIKNKKCNTKGKIYNKKTGRCKNPVKKKTKKTVKKTKKTVKKKTKIEIIKTVTPSISKKIIDMEKKIKQSKKREYSPSINKKLLTLREITPKSYIHNCSGLDIVVKTKKGNKCAKWTGKKAKEVALDNLLSDRPINCTNIIAPKQHQSNCWMNAFFMAWFISDKGRKFNRWFRETMITGKNPNKKEIKKELKKPLWLLNKMIDASLYGTRIGDDGVRFSSLMDTNDIIRQIHKVDKTKLVKTSRAFNPFTFYNIIYKQMGNFLPWQKISFGANSSKKIKFKDIQKEIKIHLEKTEQQTSKPPEVLFIEYYDAASDVKKELNISYNNINYKLDSVIIRNIKQHHFSSCITCDGKEFGFDGESYSPMQPFKWKSKLNKNTKWRFANQHDMFFNFRKGYQILLYYRV